MLGFEKEIDDFTQTVCDTPIYKNYIEKKNALKQRKRRLKLRQKPKQRKRLLVKSALKEQKKLRMRTKLLSRHGRYMKINFVVLLMTMVVTIPQ